MTRSIDNNNGVVLLLIDLSAAFDTVDHAILLERLSSRFGIRGSALAWFKSYLDNRTQFVDIEGTSSALRELNCGVPHKGLSLAPYCMCSTQPPLET